MINYEKHEIWINGIRVADRWVIFGKITDNELKYMRDPDDVQYIQLINSIDLIEDNNNIVKGKNLILEDCVAFTEYEKEYLSADNEIQLAVLNIPNSSVANNEKIIKDSSVENVNKIFL